MGTTGPLVLVGTGIVESRHLLSALRQAGVAVAFSRGARERLGELDVVVAPRLPGLVRPDARRALAALRPSLLLMSVPSVGAWVRRRWELRVLDGEQRSWPDVANDELRHRGPLAGAARWSGLGIDEIAMTASSPFEAVLEAVGRARGETAPPHVRGLDDDELALLASLGERRVAYGVPDAQWHRALDETVIAITSAPGGAHTDALPAGSERAAARAAAALGRQLDAVRIIGERPSLALEFTTGAGTAASVSNDAAARVAVGIMRGRLGQGWPTRPAADEEALAAVSSAEELTLADLRAERRRRRMRA